jgi:serine/threonine protein kinase
VDSLHWNTLANNVPGMFRWRAPELLDGQQVTVTSQSDMYAFGMTCFVSYLTVCHNGWN